ncbi:MAG: hypothetical protein M3N43_14760 [Actinomycetota bacterium]|nr:hypothetical protein [Actinomycetota bacterium]
MTAQPIFLEDRRRLRRPHIEVEHGALMATCMNATALARELIYANGSALENLRHLPAGPERDEAVRATHRVHDKAVAALNEWLAATDRYEQIKPTR